MTNVPAKKGMIVGVDGSQGSIAALRWAAARTAQFGPIRPITTWHYPWWMTATPFPGAAIPPPSDQLRDEARQEVERILSEVLGEQGRRNCVDPIITRQRAGRVLVDEGADASLIVVGTRGHGAALDALLGSVSLHVVSHASVPVVVIPDRADLSDPIRRIVVGIDSSDDAVTALAWALQHAPDDASIEVVHVWHDALSILPDHGPIPADLSELQERAARQTLDTAVVKATLIAGGSSRRVIHRLEYGDPRNVLRSVANDSDLLVLGAQGHHGVAHLLLGSVTTGLLHQPSLATVVVPAHRDTEPKIGD